jgi:hypothetical protein
MGSMNSLRLQNQQQHHQQHTRQQMAAPSVASAGVDKTTLTSFKGRRDGSAGKSPTKTGKSGASPSCCNI